MKLRLPITTKLALLFSIVCSGVIGTNRYFTHQLSKEELQQKFGLTLEGIARTLSLSIKESDHAKIRLPGHEKKPAFQKIYKLLNRAKEINNLENDCIYTFQVPKKKEESVDSLKFAVMLSKPTFIGNIYAIPNINKKIFDRVISGKSAYAMLYKDNHGQWVSGFAPIINKKTGRVTGILEIDYKVDKFLKTVEINFQKALLLDAFILLFSVVFGILMTSRILSLLPKITLASDEIAKGNYDINIEILTNDEVADLGRHFNRMAAELKEKLNLLQYIPQATIQRVKNILSKADLEHVNERKEITILISDIRDFTIFTEANPADVVMKVVNRYLDIQTLVIQKYGGTIDKYVGDEIISFFDMDDGETKASLAACEINKEVARINRSKTDENHKLEVGIGIACGPVILGDLGSSTFRDYTAIGIYVNLAARMCSHAQPNEILISDKVYKCIVDSSENKSFKIIPKGLKTYRGMSIPLEVYSISSLEES